MKEIIQEGKTVDDALKNALQKLSTTEDKVEVEVLEEGEDGFLGFIGGKDAKIRVLKTDKHNKALEFMEKIIDKMDLNIEVEKLEEKSDSEQITINLTGDNLGIVIGRRGKTLDALQYLANLAINNPQDNDEYLRVVLDAEGYRSRRKDTLRDLALRLANKAKSKEERVVLEPMPPHERKIIHSTLQDDPEVKTHSEGQDPYRKVVIAAQ